MKDRLSAQTRLLLFAALAYLFYLLYLKVGLGFEMLRSDALIYWNESLNWRRPFSTWWVPGYPLLIAALRGITFNLLPPIAVMMIISGVSYLVAVKTVYDFANHIRFSYPVHLSLLFALFPIVGLAYSVYPVADTTAIALLLLCMLSFEKRQWTRFILFAGLGLVAHKVTWFFVPLLMLIAFVKHRESRLLVPFALVPLLVWIVSGAFYHKDPLWFVRWSVENLIVSRSSFPIFDGVFGSLLSGSFAKVAKGGMVVVAFLVALVCMYHSYRLRAWLGLSASLSLLLMTAITNSYEIFVVVRFSRVLVIPLSVVFLDSGQSRKLLANGYLWATVVIVLIVSNMAFGWYMATYNYPA